MRLLATFGLILICCHAWAIETDGYRPRQDTYKTGFEEFLENLKDLVKMGNETFGIPPLDPFRSEFLPININFEKIVELLANLTNVDVRGLSTYNVNSGNLNFLALKLDLNLTLPILYAKTNYNMTGTLAGEMPFYGCGDISVIPEVFNFYAELALQLNGAYLKVKSLDIDFSLKSLNFTITGLFDDEEMSKMVSQICSDLAPEAFNQYKTEIKGLLIPYAINGIDGFLSDKTLADLWDMFN